MHGGVTLISPSVESPSLPRGLSFEFAACFATLSAKVWCPVSALWNFVLHSEQPATGNVAQATSHYNRCVKTFIDASMTQPVVVPTLPPRDHRSVVGARTFQYRVTHRMVETVLQGPLHSPQFQHSLVVGLCCLPRGKRSIQGWLSGTVYLANE